MTWKERFVQLLSKAHCFPDLGRIKGQSDDFENFDAHKCNSAKTCTAWPEKSVLYNFHGKRTGLPFWREFEASFTILRTLPLKSAILPKRAAHDQKRAFCTIFMESALFYRFQKNWRPVLRFWELWRSKMRFGQNVLRMTWKKAFCTIFMESALFSPSWENFSPVCDFENFDGQKCDLAKTCCAWPEKSVLYNFHGKRTFFTRLEENFSPVLRFWELWRSKMRFGQNVLRMTWKRAFCTIFIKTLCFPLLARISGQCADFENFHAQKFDFPKMCCAWPEKIVLFNFHEKRTVFPFGENLRPGWRFWEFWRS